MSDSFPRIHNKVCFGFSLYRWGTDTDNIFLKPFYDSIVELPNCENGYTLKEIKMSDSKLSFFDIYFDYYLGPDCIIITQPLSFINTNSLTISARVENDSLIIPFVIEEKEKNFFTDNGICTLSDLEKKFNEIRNGPDSLGWMEYSYKYWKSTINTSYIDVLGKLSIPVLIISGTEDEMMPIESVIFCKTKLSDHKNISFVIVPGADHKFYNSSGEHLLHSILRDNILPWGKSTGAF